MVAGGFQGFSISCISDVTATVEYMSAGLIRIVARPSVVFIFAAPRSATRILYDVVVVVAHFGEQVGRKRCFYERFCRLDSSVAGTPCAGSTPTTEGAVLRSFADGYEGVRYTSE